MADDILSFIERTAPTAFATGANRQAVVYDYRVLVTFEGMPEQYHKFIKSKGEFAPPRSIRVKAIFFPESMMEDFDKGGQWDPIGHTMSVFIPLNNEGKYYQVGVERVVQHELVHMVQNWIRFFTGKEHAGFPAEWEKRYGDYPEDEDLSTSLDYYAHGIEFFTWLKEVAHDFERLPSKTRYDFLYFVTAHMWFKALQDKAPKAYNRAVKELWKIVEDKIQDNPEKEALAKRHYENFLFLKKNKPALLGFAESTGGQPFTLTEAPGVVATVIKNLTEALGLPVMKSSKFQFTPYDKNNSTILKQVLTDGKSAKLISLYKESVTAQ